MTYLRVINFEKFQHYRDRKPPWIKLYRDLWGDPRFFELNETERYFLISLFVIASQNDNRIPENASWLKREMATTKAVPIVRLIDSGWLERVEQAASVPPAKPEQVASADADKSLATPPAEPPAKPEQVASTTLPPARSRETETETEKRQKGKAVTPADDRRRPFSEFFHSEFQRVRGVRLQTDKTDFIALDTLLKRTTDDEGFSLDALKEMARRFLLSDDDFHAQQGHPLRYFCANINAFVGRNVRGGTGNAGGVSPDRQAALDRLKKQLEGIPS